MAGTNIVFNSNSLQTTGTSQIVTSDIDHHSMPDKDIDIFKIAHGSRSEITWTGYPQKKITVKGYLTSDTIANMDTLIDNFKGYLTGSKNNLDIDYAGGTRRYITTAQNVKVTRPGGLMYATFIVDFICAKPFGADTATTTILTVTSGTTSPNSNAITIGGSADYQFPIIDLTLNSGTGLANGSMTFGNGLNGQVLTITRAAWVAGDTVSIDTYNSLVKVNGVEVPFTNSIPIFDKGTGQIDYSDTFTTRSVTFTVKQFKYWL